MTYTKNHKPLNSNRLKLTKNMQAVWPMIRRRATNWRLILIQTFLLSISCFLNLRNEEYVDVGVRLIIEVHEKDRRRQFHLKRH